jgi:hypothetical protein
VSGGLNRLLVAAAVVGVAATAALAGPAAALACSGSTSATSVYHECVPNGGSGKSTAGSRTGSGNRSSGNGSSGAISGRAAQAVKHAGKYGRELAAVEHTGAADLLRSNPADIATGRGAVGSAFDPASGPAAFLIALAGGAVLLLGGSGMRVWLHRRRP